MRNDAQQPDLHKLFFIDEPSYRSSQHPYPEGGKERRFSGLSPETNVGLVTRRRRFLPTLTLGPDGRPIGAHNGAFIEYFDGNEWSPVFASADDRTTRKGLENGGAFNLLRNECGIRWTAKDISNRLARLYRDGKLKIRVTATIEIDMRMFGVAFSSKYAADHINIVVENDQAFRWQQVDTSSVFYEDVLNGSLASDQVNDYERIERHAKDVAAGHNSATLKGSIAIHGIDAEATSEVFLGAEIRELADTSGPFGSRALGLSNDPDEPNAGPRIIEIQYDITKQTTTLRLESLHRGTA